MCALNKLRPLITKSPHMRKRSSTSGHRILQTKDQLHPAPNAQARLGAGAPPNATPTAGSSGDRLELPSSLGCQAPQGVVYVGDLRIFLEEDLALTLPPPSPRCRVSASHVSAATTDREHAISRIVVDVTSRRQCVHGIFPVHHKKLWLSQFGRLLFQHPGPPRWAGRSPRSEQMPAVPPGSQQRGRCLGIWVPRLRACGSGAWSFRLQAFKPRLTDGSALKPVVPRPGAQEPRITETRVLSTNSSKSPNGSNL